MALAWLMFPLVPVLLEELYYQIVVNLLGFGAVGARSRRLGMGHVGHDARTAAGLRLPRRLDRRGGRRGGGTEAGLAPRRGQAGGLDRDRSLVRVPLPPRHLPELRASERLGPVFRRSATARLVEGDAGSSRPGSGSGRRSSSGSSPTAGCGRRGPSLRRAGRVGLWRRRALPRGRHGDRVRGLAVRQLLGDHRPRGGTSSSIRA